VPVPSYDRFIEPLLRFLAQHSDGATIAEAYDALANAMKLSPEDRAEMLPSGTQAVYKNRIGWAHDRLKRGGLSSSPRRGFWKLTDEGVGLVAKNKHFAVDALGNLTISDEDLERLVSVDRTSRLKPKRDGTVVGSTVVMGPASPPAKESPEERIEAALTELRDSVARDLLELIGRAPPEFFEKLVLELLHKMGYGTSRSALQRTGGSGDGGIDGIISLDRLGLEKVYIQAKRWKNTVGSPEIQGFMGALQLQGAAKGVFVTTGAFTRDATQAATKARGTIVLVDGERLSALMIDNGVGVSHKALTVPKVDSDYFDEG
jgi:restriction system protein